MSNIANITFLLPFLIFLFVSLLIVGLLKTISEYKTKKKLVTLASKSPKRRDNIVFDKVKTSLKLEELFQSLYKLSVPSDGWQDSNVKLKFVRAGFRDSSAPMIFYSIKTLLFLGLPLLFSYFILQHNASTSVLLAYLLCLSAVGYYVPEFYLSYRIKKRHQEMQDNLADFIDLLVMCTVSGLGLDAALNRVSTEMLKSSPVLSEEFYLTCLEIRAGVARIDALKNLALRSNVDDLHNLVTMLVQADKFGTSLSESMRVQSDYMRVTRMQRAEEIAAKIPVKMLIPLILFIFPSLLTVLLGPAFIQIGGALK